MGVVRIDVLGPWRVVVDEHAVAIEGERRQRLLAALIARRGTECSADWLIDLVWGDEPPTAAATTLQSHVAHLRRLLEPARPVGSEWAVIRSVSHGYLLAAERIDVDIDRVVRLANEGRHLGDPGAALRCIDEAVALHRGPAFADLIDHPHFLAESERWERRRLDLAEHRLDLLTALHRVDDVIDGARALTESHPLREQNWMRLATTLARQGRQAEALRSLDALRALLVAELGIDPSPEVRDLERQILLQALPPTPGPSVDQHRRTEPAPRLRYADADGVHIAYQVIGDGPTLVAAPPFAQNIEICWQDPHHRRMLERASQRCRFIHFDKRGTGMSDRGAGMSVSERLTDFLAVMDAAEVDQAVLCGVSEGGPMAIAFAAAHPERVAGLFLVNTYARTTWAPDHPIGAPAEALAAVSREWEMNWGRHAAPLVEWFAPSMTGDDAYLEWMAHYMRQSCSPGTLAEINRANASIDVRHLLGSISAPTMVVHRSGDRVCPVAWGRHLAEHIPGATFVELAGSDHLPWIGPNWSELLDLGLDFVHRVASRRTHGTAS